MNESWYHVRIKLCQLFSILIHHHKHFLDGQGNIITSLLIKINLASQVCSATSFPLHTLWPLPTCPSYPAHSCGGHIDMNGSEGTFFMSLSIHKLLKSSKYMYVHMMCTIEMLLKLVFGCVHVCNNFFLNNRCTKKGKNFLENTTKYIYLCTYTPLSSPPPHMCTHTCSYVYICAMAIL